MRQNMMARFCSNLIHDGHYDVEKPRTQLTFEQTQELCEMLLGCIESAGYPCYGYATRTLNWVHIRIGCDIAHKDIIADIIYAIYPYRIALSLSNHPLDRFKVNININPFFTTKEICEKVNRAHADVYYTK